MALTRPVYTCERSLGTAWGQSHKRRRNHEAMKSWRHWLVVGAIVFGCLPGVAGAASEVDILLNKLVEKGILNNVDAGQIRREITETKEERNKQLAKEIVPDSARNWKWKGDLRLRNEYRNRVGTGNDVNRQRIRFRYGFEGKANDQLKVTARLATGTTLGGSVSGSTATTPFDDPTSTNKTFDDFFRKKPIVLDLAYVEYSPEIAGISKVTAIGGMMENPLWTVTPMVWDPDLTWDGVALKLSKELGPVTVFSNNGAFALDSDESEPAALWVVQGGASVTPFANSETEVLKNLKLTSALAYHDYMNVTTSAKAGTDPITRIATNTASVKDFNQLNPSVELASQVAGYPVSLFGDWVHNASASSSGNDGFMVGLKVGKATQPFSLTNLSGWLKKGWEAGYFFERLERDAAFDEFVDSDFGGGGTNRYGNVWWVTLAMLKHSTLGAKVLQAEQVTGAKAGEDRILADWVTTF